MKELQLTILEFKTFKQLANNNHEMFQHIVGTKYIFVTVSESFADKFGY